MRALKAFAPAVALIAAFASVSRADEWNKKTYLTFSGPVQIPGASLPAGTYTFELASPDSSRHVIRVSSRDGAKTYGLFITIPNERLDPPDENVVMFQERPAGSPQAIHAWFYPGDRIGEEFVYPRKQAMAIAKATRRGVLSTSDAELKDTNAARNAPVARVDEHGNPSAAGTASAQARTEEPRTAPPPVRPESAPTAGSATEAGTAGRTAGVNSSPRRLPGTASDLPSLALLSGVAMAGALTARQLRRRFSKGR